MIKHPIIQSIHLSIYLSIYLSRTSLSQLSNQVGRQPSSVVGQQPSSLGRWRSRFRARQEMSLSYCTYVCTSYIDWSSILCFPVVLYRSIHSLINSRTIIYCTHPEIQSVVNKTQLRAFSISMYAIDFLRTTTTDDTFVLHILHTLLYMPLKSYCYICIISETKPRLLLSIHIALVQQIQQILCIGDDQLSTVLYTRDCIVCTKG